MRWRYKLVTRHARTWNYHTPHSLHHTNNSNRLLFCSNFSFPTHSKNYIHLHIIFIIVIIVIRYLFKCGCFSLEVRRWVFLIIWRGKNVQFTLSYSRLQQNWFNITKPTYTIFHCLFSTRPPVFYFSHSFVYRFNGNTHHFFLQLSH